MTTEPKYTDAPIIRTVRIFLVHATPLPNPAEGELRWARR